MAIQSDESVAIKVFKFADGAQWGNAWTTNPETGRYEISGLPLNTVFVVVVEKGKLKMKNLAFSKTAGQKAESVDLTPTSTVTTELVSENATELLKKFDTDIRGVVQNIEDEVNKYYSENELELKALETAVNTGILPELDDVEAEAIIKYDLTVNVSHLEAGTVSPNSRTYLKGTKIKLQVAANPPWRLMNWTGEINDDNEVEMTGDKTVTANFSKTVVLRFFKMFAENEAGFENENVELTISPAPLWIEAYDTTLVDEGGGYGGGEFPVGVWEYTYKIDTPVNIKMTKFPDNYRWDVMGVQVTQNMSREFFSSNWKNMIAYYDADANNSETIILTQNSTFIREIHTREKTKFTVPMLGGVSSDFDALADDKYKLPDTEFTADKLEHFKAIRMAKDEANLYVRIDVSGNLLTELTEYESLPVGYYLGLLTTWSFDENIDARFLPYINGGRIENRSPIYDSDDPIEKDCFTRGVDVYGNEYIGITLPLDYGSLDNGVDCFIRLRAGMADNLDDIRDWTVIDSLNVLGDEGDEGLNGYNDYYIKVN